MTNKEIEVSKDALPLLGEVRGLLSSGCHEAYLVGGYVRDSILGRPTRDIDLAVQGPVEELARKLADSLGGSLVILGRERLVARVVLSRDPGTGTVWQVDLSPMAADIHQDLEGRDFTIDSLAVRLDDIASNGRARRVIDPFGGLDDLRGRIIRAVGPDLFRKDPARLLRAVRLSVELNFSIAQYTQSLIRRDVALLAQTAPERIRTDFCALLATERSYQGLHLMEDLGLLRMVVPELEEGRGVDQPREHFWDVYHHCLETIGALDQLLGDKADARDEFISSLTWAGEFTAHLGGAHARRAVMKLAGLLHDVGKPRTKTVEDSGRIRFFGHPSVGAEMAGTIMKRLHFSRQDTQLVQTIVLHHLRPGLICKHGELPTARAMYRYFRDAGEAAIDTVLVNLADYRAARGPLLQWEEWNRYAERCRYILSTGLNREGPAEPKPLVNGHDLMREFELSPGPLIGRLTEEVKEARAAGEITTREQAVELVGRSLGLRHVRS